MVATEALAESPITSLANLTSLPSSSPNLIAIGARDNSGFRSPFGLPRCAQTISEVPCDKVLSSLEVMPLFGHHR